MAWDVFFEEKNMVILGGPGALEHATLSHFECPKFDVFVGCASELRPIEVRSFRGVGPWMRLHSGDIWPAVRLQYGPVCGEISKKIVYRIFLPLIGFLPFLPIDKNDVSV